MTIDYKNYRSCLLGDSNIDFFSKSALHKRFIALTKAYGFHQLMSVSTRPVSGTLLDHVLINCRDNVLESGTLSLTLSNNLPFYVSLKSRAIKLQSRGHKLMPFCSKKNFSVDAFLADLECLTMDLFSKPNEALEFFTQKRAGFSRSSEKTSCRKGIHT